MTIDQATQTLAQSERGRQAMRDLFTLIDNGASGLDSEGGQALLALLALALSGKAGSVRDSVREEVSQ